MAYRDYSYRKGNKGKTYNALRVMLRRQLKPGETNCANPNCTKYLSILEKMFSDYCFKCEQLLNQNKPLI